jgi:hypothetical protein
MWHIHAWQVISMILLVAVLVYHRRRAAAANPAAARSSTGAAVKKAPPAPKVEQPPEQVFADLRRQALATDPSLLALPGELGPDDAFGLLMEIGISGSVVTLACFADGDARLLYRSGGGMIGGIGHETVRKAAKDLVALAQAALPLMTPATAHPLPGPEQIRFYVLTGRGAMTTETDRKSLAEQPTQLSALFQSGQQVVAEMRQVGEQRAQAAG